jgi:dTDP-4-dehydrorhamnose 3,5-epimerase
LPDVLLIEPKVFGDDRGFFYESFNQRAFAQATGVDPVHFVQDNHSKSAKGVCAACTTRCKTRRASWCVWWLVRCLTWRWTFAGIHPPYGKWVGELLSAENKRQLWVPPGLAHGFVVLSRQAEFLYKTTDYYAPEHERCIAWNDPTLAIAWPEWASRPGCQPRTSPP